ncbi:MAG: hypothetical protein ACYTHJ_17260 [Planctomycetota bacterium]|jgi:hypothetical protein
MNIKQRDIAFHRWSAVIGGETRDLHSLEQIFKRALADSDVQQDTALQRMIQAEVENRRVELKQERQGEEPSSSPSEPRPNGRSELPPTHKQVLESFNGLSLALYASLERGDEDEARVVLGKLRLLQVQCPGVIPASAIAASEHRVEKLQARIKELADEIEGLTAKAVSASRDGKEQQIARSMRRLTAIHAAHPGLLDEVGLEDVRRDVVNAADERRQHRDTTRKLVERERAIAAEIKALAAAVRDYHRVAWTAQDTSEEYVEAEERYRKTFKKVRTYDTDWFSGIILELADILAEWTVPPPGAEGQIDRFLDSISKGLAGIHTDLSKIECEKDSRKSDQGKSDESHDQDK